jgi:hypothetical protein
VACTGVAAHGEDRVPPVSASSVHDGGYPAAYAVDGDPKTRWASAVFSGKLEWLQLDFGQTVRLESLAIVWEAAHAAQYKLLLSADGKTWQSIHHQTKGAGGREVIEGLAAEGRYLRVECLAPSPHQLFSIWEIEFPKGDAGRILREHVQAVTKALARERQEQVARAFGDLGLEEFVFAARQNGADGHWYANFGYYAADAGRKCYRADGRLGVLNAKTGAVRLLVDDPKGSVRDPFVHYDAGKVLFSWRKGGAEQFHLYEINVDGTGLRQLTDGLYDDIEPAYLPDGGIVFVSSRCKRWVNCWLTQVAVLHRCDADGSNIRQISANVEHDNTPWVLPDGRILYLRWEYVDRSQVDYHHLWTANPDGTNQMVCFGNSFPGSVYIDAKPIPGTNEVLLVDSPGHGQNEHAGSVAVLDLTRGPDDRSALRRITGEGYRDPYPLTRDLFLAAKDRRLLLIGRDGSETELFALPNSFGGANLHEPRPIVPRPREHVVPSRVSLRENSGLLILADAHAGRNMKGVKPGEIRKLLVLESLPKPINYTGGMDPLSYGGTFTLERLAGSVPVEPDGSAYFELPANRAFFFVALDANDLSVKRMQSFLTVMPGETLGCVGCHEQRTQARPPAGGLLAMRRPPSKLTPVPGVPEVLDFPRDVQPILDRHCVRCHGYDRREGAGPNEGPCASGVILTGDRGPMFSHSYFALTLRRQFVDGRNDPKSNLPPRSIGTSASPLMEKIRSKHQGVELSARETDVVRYWIETGAAYPGTYAALGTGMLGGYAENNQVETDRNWPEAKAAADAIQRRCASCHAGPRTLPANLSDEREVSFWRMDLKDPRLPLSRHRVFNLTRPEKSLMLLAPLAKPAGGFGSCAAGARDGPKEPIFAATGDPDYQKLLALMEAGKRRLETIKRFDMPGFRPRREYLREMKRYGVLPADLPDDAVVDPYDTDRAYWKSLWHVPQQ